MEEPNDIAIVLPHFTAPSTNAQMANLSNTAKLLRHSDSDGIYIYIYIYIYINIYVEILRFILDCVTLVE